MKNQKLSVLCNEIGLDECIDSDYGEKHADDADQNDADDLDAFEPGSTVPAHSLEHAPESVYKM